MGYLINPVGFRVGQTRGWVDTWFAYYDFYPEFLHFVLKMRFFLNYFLSSMPDSDSGFFDDSILYSHFRIVLNISTVFVSLFYYNSTIMELVNNFTYVPRYLTSKFFYSKTYFKRGNMFNLDLPKNNNFHFLINKLTVSKELSNSRRLSLSYSKVLNKNLKVINILKNSRNKLMQYLSFESYPKMSLRFWNRVMFKSKHFFHKRKRGKILFFRKHSYSKFWLVSKHLRKFF